MISLFKNLFNKEQVDVAAKLAEGAIIVDVRTPGEFATGHVKGSINIPLNDIQNHVNDLKSKNKVIITVCRSGARAGSATSFLRNAGIETYNAGSWNSVQALV
ncbi:MAG TPA: rhodanese-like domain-containing protein [Saprospiraceae bacterium]|nr:rhodanese-like domain-containing protein [Saprospiraceae bacterium]